MSRRDRDETTYYGVNDFITMRIAAKKIKRRAAVRSCGPTEMVSITP